MAGLLSNFFADPMYYIGFLFAMAGALACILFLRGFLSGIGHVLAQDGHVEHMHHFRARAVWGVLLMGFIFVVWEMVRLVFSFFGYGPVSGLGVFLAVVALIVWALNLLYKTVTGKGGGH